ncbi:hypothetical protein R3P38DRAFT_2865875 [Favolaschia claudopus]|uniref:Geranylgeranyl pyrophosphate synthetase n=1 Tax=Favolaschia claudopus TaxID=2862362 RepID=A0AAW0DGM2_9AGAR
MYSSQRGRGRGRGSSSANRFANSAPSTPLPAARDIMEGLRPSALQTISIPAAPATVKDIKITNFESIGSYNWKNAASPTIIVPGSPPEWQNKQTPYQVPPDTGIFFSDQNGFRMPQAVLLPLIVAVDKVQSESANASNAGTFDWAAENIDFITDRNGLRKLLRWIEDAGANPESRNFRIDLQLAGNTVLMNRWETETRVNYSGYTYGFNFEKASTDPAIGCEGSTGHHRVVKYDLDGLRMVVRFEVDACLPASAKAKSSGSAKASTIDDLVASLGEVKLGGASAKTTSTTTHGLTVLPGGGSVSHSSLLELTTRTERRAAEFDWKDAYPQLFFSQTPHHFLAVHYQGRFSAVNKRQLGSSELKGVERSIQPGLRKLRVALGVIRDLVVKHGERGRLTLVCRRGRMEVFERVSAESCLPDEVLARFEG